ncbi:MAG: hypothetical protein FWE28_00115 [Oscillospiraceae bacterium]|nr:hypothetical protein [Oscillospiraceae bacterium]
MKVFVNLPELEEDKIELENRIADFHATLLIEKIRGLHTNDITKEKLLNMALEHIKEKENDV